MRCTLTGARVEYRLGSEELKRIEHPAQFICGNHDPFGGLAVGREAARLMPNAALHEIRAGHLPHDDKPAETGRGVRAFFERAG